MKPLMNSPLFTSIWGCFFAELVPWNIAWNSAVFNSPLLTHPPSHSLRLLNPAVIFSTQVSKLPSLLLISLCLNLLSKLGHVLLLVPILGLLGSHLLSPYFIQMKDSFLLPQSGLDPPLPFAFPSPSPCFEALPVPVCGSVFILPHICLQAPCPISSSYSPLLFRCFPPLLCPYCSILWSLCLPLVRPTIWGMAQAHH